jgi:transposase InsO family protein
MALSHAFAHQQGNGVIERFFRTLKEQAISRWNFRTTAEVRAAVTDFVAGYNAAWRQERLGYLTRQTTGTVIPSRKATPHDPSRGSIEG